MAKKQLILKDCDAERARILSAEIGKVRCWLSGYSAGRSTPGTIPVSVPGEDALRQMQIILKDAITDASK